MMGEIEVRAYVPTGNAGLSDIALRDSKIVFVRGRGNAFSAQVQASKQAYSPGGKAELTVSLKDAKLQPTSGAVGLSVIDAKVLDVDPGKVGLERIYYSLIMDLMNPT